MQALARWLGSLTSEQFYPRLSWVGLALIGAVVALAFVLPGCSSSSQPPSVRDQTHLEGERWFCERGLDQPWCEGWVDG